MTNSEIANMIDHTILKANATLEDVEKLCQEAIDNNFASVCINPCWVKAASQYLKANKKGDYEVKTCTVIVLQRIPSCLTIFVVKDIWMLCHYTNMVSTVLWQV